MHFSAALVAGALFLRASAFLIPPEVSTAAEAAKGQLETLWSTQSQIYELDCPGCPFPSDQEGDAPWEEDVENRIHLEFRIDDLQRLRINNATVFPVDISRPLDIHVFAPQVRASDLHRSQPVQLGFALDVHPLPVSRDEPDKKLLRAKFTVLDLKGTPVEVDTVKVDLLLLRTETTSTLSIAKISSEPFEETPGAVDCAGSSQWSLCRLRAMVTARLQGMLEAAKDRAAAAHAWIKKPGCHGKAFGKSDQKEKHEHHKDGHKFHKSGHKHGDKYHKHHRMFHRIGHMLHQAIRFFIVPALLGVIGGLMASAVGMLVGQIIVYMWFRFHRNGQRGHVRMVEAAVVPGEKDALMDDPPHYEDVEVVVIEDERR